MYEQYYTEKVIGEQLVKMLPQFDVNQCVELSAGQGALLEPVVRRWPYVKLTTCELDPSNVEILTENFVGTHYNIDVLNAEFEEKFDNNYNYYDLAISNPPYSWKYPSNYDHNLLKEFGIQEISKHKRIRTEVLFILQNIKLLRNGGFAAFILPELIISSDLLKEFRKKMLTFCSIFSLAEMKPGVFKGTEAKTYILVIKKSKENINFIHTSLGGVQESRQSIDFVNCIRDIGNKYENLSDLFDIRRGNLTGKECKKLGIYSYHTSGFFNKNAEFETFESMFVTQPVFAKCGDLLISRVGTRVLANITELKSDRCIISDCIFRLRLFDTNLNSYFIKF